jgi:hypothetical protein
MTRRFAIVLALLPACSDAATHGGSVFAGESTTPTSEGDPPPDDVDVDDGAAASDEGSSVGSSGSSESSSDESSSGGGGPALDPPAGGSSGGSGGGPIDAELVSTPSGVMYRLIAPADPGPLPFLLVYSGTEGSQPMSINLLSFRGMTGTEGFVFAVLHGVEYYGDTQAGIDVIEDVRAHYDIDNDRTYLMSESAGTITGLSLGLDLRQSYFAAYWANDVNTAATPTRSADELGFAPWGNAGPGGQYELAGAIVDGMRGAGYRIEDPAPYDGPGAGTHGDLEQLVAAIAWFPGKTRQ